MTSPRRRGNPRPTTALRFYKCPGENDACPGDRTGAGDDLCGANNYGVRCASCRSGYYRSGDDDGNLICKSCDEGGKATAWVVYSFLGAGTGILLAWMMLTSAGRETFVLLADTQGGAADDIVGVLDEVGEAMGEGAAAVMDAAPKARYDAVGLTRTFTANIGKVKALCAFFQILASIPEVFGDSLFLPFAYRQFCRFFNIFMLGLPKLVPTRCLSAISDEVFYVRTLLFTTLFPVFTLCVLAGGFRLDTYLHPVSKEQLQDRKDLYIEAFLLFIHLALPLLAITSVQALVCDSFDDGPGGDVSYQWPSGDLAR